MLQELVYSRNEHIPPLKSDHMQDLHLMIDKPFLNKDVLMHFVSLNLQCVKNKFRLLCTLEGVTQNWSTRFDQIITRQRRM